MAISLRPVTTARCYYMSTEKQINYVHKNTILCETIIKENRCSKLNTEFFINPYCKLSVITPKPNSPHGELDGPQDESLLEGTKRVQQPPALKYSYPLTSNQEYGWINQTKLPAVDNVKLTHPRMRSEITTYMDAYWLQKEQAENMN